MMLFVLGACGGNKYDDAINSIIDRYKKQSERVYEDDGFCGLYLCSTEKQIKTKICRLFNNKGQKSFLSTFE